MPSTYSPNGLVEDPEKFGCCCRCFHIKTGARILAVLQFLFYALLMAFKIYSNPTLDLGVFLACFFITFYSFIVIVGVFGQKRFLLLPFLIVEGIIALTVSGIAVAYGIIGAATDSLVYAHKNITMVRELYEVHHMNPDDEKIQTLFSCGLLVVLIIMAVFHVYMWWVFYCVYRYFKLRDTIIGPGYHRGTAIADNINHEYNK